MRKKITLIGVILVGAAIQANAGLFGLGVPDGMKMDCLEKHSKAWCIWDAAGVSRGTKDMKRDEAMASFGKSKNSGNLELGMAALSTFDFMQTKADLFGKGGGIGMLLLGSVVKGGSAAVVGSNQVYGWMPIEMAKTPEDAGKLLKTIIADATKEAMGDRLGDYFEEPVGDGFITKKGWKLKGDSCNNGCEIYNRSYKNNGVERVSKAEKGKAPEWMGGYDAWVFGDYGSQNVFELQENGTMMTHKYVLNLSTLLPSWAFVSVSSQFEWEGKIHNSGISIPLVVNNGEVMMPIYPEIKLTVSNKGQENK